MKKLLLSLFFGITSAVCFADETPDYLTVRFDDGRCASYKLDGLKLLFSDTQGITVVSPGADDEKFPVMGIEAFAFTTTDLTAIEAAPVVDEDDAMVFSTDGRLVARGKDALRNLSPGIYVVKAAGQTKKISVR